MIEAFVDSALDRSDEDEGLVANFGLISVDGFDHSYKSLLVRFLVRKSIW